MTSIDEVQRQIDQAKETARQLGEKLKEQQRLIEEAKRVTGR